MLSREMSSSLGTDDDDDDDESEEVARKPKKHHESVFLAPAEVIKWVAFILSVGDGFISDVERNEETLNAIET